VLLSWGRGDDRLQATRGASRPTANIEAKSPRSRGSDKESPVRKKPSTLPMVLILLGLGLGPAVLLVFGGALAALLYFKQTITTTTVTSTPPQAPRNAAPVVPLDPEPAKKPIQAAPPAQGAAGVHNPLPLQELKAATVYIKGQTATMASRGSGFVVHAQGGTVYIATNHHVISPSVEDVGPFPPFFVPRMPGIPFGPRMPSIPFGPRMPFGPHLPLPPHHGRPLGGLLGSPALELTVVFHSGTTKEQSLPAAVVGEDAANDLAILRATGVIDAPRPIDYRQTPELRETMPVVAFGFPFGEKLDLQEKDPAITVRKGAISALRGEGGQVEKVQLDLELNPGNSGGPVVDERGVLIGVAVAKWGDTRIGFAILVSQLKSLLQGRIDAPTTIESLTVNGRQQIRVRVRASDPFGKLRAPTLLYGLDKEVRMPRKGPNGWEPLSGAKSSELTLQGTEAIATLALTVPANGQHQLIVQVSYQTAAGQTVHGEPRTLSLGAVKLSPAVAPRPRRTPKGEELTKLLADLKSPDEATRQRAASVFQQAPPRQRRAEVRRGLQEILSASDPATRKAGVLALAACDPKEAAPSLAKLLADDVLEVRQTVATSLRELRDPRVAEMAAARLPVEPVIVLDVLKAIGPAAEKAVLPYLADEYAGGTRFWAINVLKDIGTAAGLPALEAVPGPDALHARNVIQAIRERLPLTAAQWPHALDDLRSSDPLRRARGARRIAATPASAERRAEVVARLEGLLHDRFPDVCAAAAQGLCRWAGPEAIALLAKQMEGFHPPMHAAAIEALAEMKSAEAAAAIAKRLPDVHDRTKATQALKAMEAKVAEKAVLPLVESTDPFVRAEVIKVLADVGGRDSIAALEKLANEDNLFYSSLARQALEAIQDRGEGEK
jgi:S1-C subfamily serine protease/HEAT repeat protein